MTLQQRLKAAQLIKKLNIIHEYYMANPKTTMKQAALFTDQTITTVQKYSLIRSECRRLIDSVIDRRYGCAWPAEDEGCFGNYDIKLKSCAICGSAVECYHASDIGEGCTQGRTGWQSVDSHTQLPIAQNLPCMASQGEL